MAEYIDRKALGIGKCNPDIFEDKGYARGWNSAIEIIEEAPTVDVEPVKHGQWKHVAGMNSKCSKCDRYFPISEFDKRPFDVNYCPNCGAKMDGKEVQS